MKVNEFKKEIRKRLLSSLSMLSENASNIPMGAENDPSAPWNQSDNPEIESYRIVYDQEKFEVTLTNGRSAEVDFIDFLNRYWDLNKGSFEQHHQLFGEDEANTDKNIIKYLRDQKYDFAEDLYEILSRDESLFEPDEPDYDRDDF